MSDEAGTGPLADVISDAFAITAGSATQLVFTSQPTTTIAGDPIADFAVEARDAYGNVDEAFGSTVAIGITSGTGTTGAVLSGTVTGVAFTNGVATFSGLSIDLEGPGYTLTVSDEAGTGPLADVISDAFDITAAPE